MAVLFSVTRHDMEMVGLRGAARRTCIIRTDGASWRKADVKFCVSSHISLLKLPPCSSS